MLKKVALAIAILLAWSSPIFAQTTATASATVTVGGGPPPPPPPPPPPTATATATVTVSPSTITVVPFTDLVIDNAPPLNLPNKAIGDINKDGLIDVVVAESCITGGGMFWYQNPGSNGSGTWIKHRIFSGSWSTDMQVADIDGDGYPDIITAKNNGGCGNGNEVYWYQNPGASGGAWIEHDIGWSGFSNGAHDIEVGDFNKDGKIDVAVNGGLFIQNSPTSWTFVNIGRGGQEGTGVGSIIGDGYPDIIGPGPNGSVIWFENPQHTGQPVTGTWIQHTVIASGWTANMGITLADINGDGKIDIVVSNAESPGKIVWYQQPSNPRTGVWVSHLVGLADYVHTFKVADVNHDGKLDVVFAEMQQSSQHRVGVFYNTGGGLSWVLQVISTVGSHNIRVGDITSNGNTSIMGANWLSSGAIDHGAVHVWRNDLPPATLDSWTYIHADSTRAASQYGNGDFGLGFGDINGDGFQDIASGHYFYRNPGGNMTTVPWPRVTLPSDPSRAGVLDASLLFSAAGSGNPSDILAEYLPDVVWLHTNDQGVTWTPKVVAQVLRTGHGNSRTVYLMPNISPGSTNILLSGGDGIYSLQMPTNPNITPWPTTKITSTASEQKGFGVGDINGDGHPDIATNVGESGPLNKNLYWWTNPWGNGLWVQHPIGTTVNQIKMVVIADINGDGRPDVVVSEEANPANVYWFEAPLDPINGTWIRHTVATGLAEVDSMSVADMDHDGHLDIVVGEIFGSKRVIIYQNANAGSGWGSSWVPHVVSSGKESHNGTRVIDLNGDGKLDIVSIAYWLYQDLHIWRNDNQ
jgi:FG-GAP-like repeat